MQYAFINFEILVSKRIKICTRLRLIIDYITYDLHTS